MDGGTLASSHVNQVPEAQGGFPSPPLPSDPLPPQSQREKGEEVQLQTSVQLEAVTIGTKGLQAPPWARPHCLDSPPQPQRSPGQASEDSCLPPRTPGLQPASGERGPRCVVWVAGE